MVTLSSGMPRASGRTCRSEGGGRLEQLADVRYANQSEIIKYPQILI